MNLPLLLAAITSCIASVLGKPFLCKKNRNRICYESLRSASIPPLPETVIVDIADGSKLEGVRRNISDYRFYYSFRGIPYARPPVGELRFKDPEPYDPWGSNIRKNYEPSCCPQTDFTNPHDSKVKGDEDCLYLHVYSPKVGRNKLPVMVYIHGGSYLAGDADSEGGNPQKLLTKDIVLVSIQYRLGTLGFLSTGDSVIPGNFGLKDQTFALEWIHYNIEYFGGDPNRVTLFGNSAGGAAVQFQTLTPYSKGLFNRAILQSGNALAPWALSYEHEIISKSIGEDLNCTLDDSFTLLNCLKASPMESLVKSLVRYADSLTFYMVPRVDGDYLPASPAQLIRDGAFHKVDLISGVCQNELDLQVKGIHSNVYLNAYYMENFDNTAPYFFNMFNETHGKYVIKRMFYRYMDSIDFSDKNFKNLEKLNSDAVFTVSHDEVTSHYCRNREYGKNTYRYELQHAPEWSRGTLVNLNRSENSVSHTDELYFLFDEVNGFPPLRRPADVFLSDIMVTLWTNFAACGNPTPDMDLGFVWDPVCSPDDFRYLSLTPAPEMKDDNRSKNREFWRNLPLRTNMELYPERFQKKEPQCTT